MWRWVLAATAASAACGRVEFAPQEGLVMWLPLDDAPGERLIDASGRGHHAHCTPPACPAFGVDGPRARAVTFDGVDDVIRIPHTPAFDLATFTISLSARLHVIPPRGEHVSLLNRQYGPGNADIWFVGYLAPDSDYCFSISTSESAPAQAFVSGGPSAGDVDTWVHLAATYDGSVARIYRDGLEVSAEAIGGVIAVDATAITIGGADNGSGTPNEHVNASIDDVRLYDRVLTADELAEL